LVGKFGGVGSEVTVEVANAEDVRDYVDPDDIMEAVLAAVRSEKGERYELVNVCSGRAVSLGEFVGIFGKISGKSFLIRETSRDKTRSVGSPEKARRLLGWAPAVPIEESVRKALARTPERRR